MTHNKTHRSLVETYRLMKEESESGMTKGQMLSKAADLEDALDSHTATKHLCKKAESIQRGIRKAFKPAKVEEAMEDMEDMEEMKSSDDYMMEDDELMKYYKTLETIKSQLHSMGRKEASSYINKALDYLN